jgi:hypothetical protein
MAPLSEEAFPPSVRAAASVLRLDELTSRVIGALRRVGIRTIVLKGPSIARWLYMEGSQRPYVDSDLLVSPKDLEASFQVLKDLRFEHPRGPIAIGLPGDRAPYAYAWIHRPTGARLELHQTLIGVRVSPEQAWLVLSRHTVNMMLSGETVEVLDVPARAMHVALHAAQDGGRAPRAMEDLRRALRKAPYEMWGQSKAVAEELDAVRALAFGLRLRPEGRELARALDLLGEDSVDVLLHAESSVSSARSFEWLASQKGMSPKIRLVTVKLFPPVTFMRAWKPLARRGRLGLSLAYLWRPLWVCGQAIPGLLAWLRARRRAAHGPDTYY